MQTLSKEEERLSKEATKYIQTHTKELIDKFSKDSFFQPETVPISVYMAGSPGAGKTEFSKNFIKRIKDKHVVRIDADEIREMLPGYNGKKSYIFQRACSRGVDKLQDNAFKKRKNFIFDSTFSNYGRAKENIERSLKYGREVFIIYLYQDPLVAWDFTQKREKLEGRNIRKEDFIREFFAAKQNIEEIKQLFGQHVQVYLIKKDYKNRSVSAEMNISKIDSYLKKIYTEEELNRLLP